MTERTIKERIAALDAALDAKSKRQNKNAEETAEEIVDRIIADLSDRGGLSGEWDLIDDATRQGIIVTWRRIVIDALTALTAPTPEVPHRSTDPYDWGYMNSMQDRYEGCSFASSGGKARRADMVAPDYVPEDQREEYLRGCRAYCDDEYGEGWEK